ncbi:uncharacterized protein LOC18431800 isoform X1 [Amborella trichopoda]|uniref:Uncharacterized protein n=1 Tax=Amborella trichopoda TaxID=13333 RepID=W1P6X4_AMBTC|nr:uncharacterized protein LOC18431800 isoform X1 [Amborella trichopoda]ERN03658.1 hypothetical protein AMTR_s00144p00055810 [Amborella trichopoda]|eukprot:XP_006841983.1 uncharacterized protein LOC18431800 isoform X1 [Amborella trichopoda]
MANPKTPPPIIGKAGRYTVFLTPKQSPPQTAPLQTPSPKPLSPRTPIPEAKPSPPVQPPPLQFETPKNTMSSSHFGFFWSAIAKVQHVHSSVDEYLADLFGLNQSKYQWALNEYYETNATDIENGNLKGQKCKGLKMLQKHNQEVKKEGATA